MPLPPADDASGVQVALSATKRGSFALTSRLRACRRNVLVGDEGPGARFHCCPNRGATVYYEPLAMPDHVSVPVVRSPIPIFLLPLFPCMRGACTVGLCRRSARSTFREPFAPGGASRGAEQFVRNLGYSMSDFPTLETDRLILREIVASDAPALYDIHSDARAMRWFGSDPLVNLQHAEKLIETFASWRQMPNPGTRWGIERKSDNRLLGTCGLFKWNRGWRSCIAGYELARSAWGAGFMVEALSAALTWGFEHMELNRVEAQVHPENVASIRLLRTLGFVEEGRLREAGFWLGEYHDLLQFALLQSEYLTLRRADNPRPPHPPNVKLVDATPSGEIDARPVATRGLRPN